MGNFRVLLGILASGTYFGVATAAQNAWRLRNVYEVAAAAL